MLSKKTCRALCSSLPDLSKDSDGTGARKAHGNKLLGDILVCVGKKCPPWRNSGDLGQGVEGLLLPWMVIEKVPSKNLLAAII